MKKLIQLVCFVGLACLAGSFVKAEKVTTMSYDQIITSPTGEIITSKVWVKGKKMRVEQIARGTKVVTLMKKGNVHLYYYPSQKMAVKMYMPAGIIQRHQENPREMAEYLKSTKAKPLGQEKIEGKLCDIYQVSYPQGIRGKVWIWRRKNFPLKLVVGNSGESITIEYKNLQMSISIPDNLFELPPGTQIEDPPR